MNNTQILNNINSLVLFANDGVQNSRIIDITLLKQSIMLATLSYSLKSTSLVKSGFFDITAIGAKKTNRINFKIKKIKSLEYMEGFTGLLKKKSNSSIRALYAAKKCNNKYVIAVSIAGSRINIADWQTNIDMGVQNSYHRGFYNSTLKIIDDFNNIEFPQLANELGLNKLTLMNIINECKLPRSPFLIWINGHSKGAGIMQILISQLIDSHYVLPKNIIGFGFASPRVINYDFASKPYDYPVINIINSDDIVPKMASVAHIGLCLEYESDNLLRATCYNFGTDKNTLQIIGEFESVWPKLSDTSNIMASMYAFLQIINESGNDDLEIFLRSHLKNTNLLSHNLEKLSTWFVNIRLNNLDKMHDEIYHMQIDKSIVQSFYNFLSKLLKNYTLKEVLNAYLILNNNYHSIAKTTTKSGVYSYIVNNMCGLQTTYIWDNKLQKQNIEKRIIVQRPVKNK